MGMDVSGVAPTTKRGKYFRNNMWWWRPLWNYAYQTSDGLITESMWNKGHHNDGAGLDAPQAERLASLLRSSIDDGSCEQYAVEYKQHLERVPDEVCSVCKGTGKRQASTFEGHEGRDCMACKGKGKRRPIETWYPFATDNVETFVEFLEGCGGFQIW